ncbi:MAG: redoxin domain-containing protein, partial [Deltaproteobacteria bacterium]|nr:redoxin domain-containing protein [Deltaproteobacteria bacterium]
TRVAGVSRDDANILKYWGDELGITFPLLSNVTGYLGSALVVQDGGSPVFSRRTVIIDRKGQIRYARDGSPDYRDILLHLKALEEEHP